MQIDIRRISPANGPELKAVRLAALTDSPSAFGSTYAEEAARSDADWSARARLASTGIDRITFLARVGERTVGIAGGYRDDVRPTQVDLVSMWTAPAVRRSGAGRLLVGSVIEWAAETGASSVGLWVTRGNSPAQLLYESMGFRETGDHQPLPSDPCTDEVRMMLDLPARLAAVHRADDNELCGFVDDRADGWHALTVFGASLGAYPARLDAEMKVMSDGLASLMERWILADDSGSSEQVVCIQEANEYAVTVVLDYYALPGVPALRIQRAELDTQRWTLRPNR